MRNRTILKLIFVMVFTIFFFQWKVFFQDFYNDRYDNRLDKLPTEKVFTYENDTPKPTYTGGYLIGQPIDMISNTTRLMDGEAFRQDTPYCIYNGHGIRNKQRTQRRPDTWTETIPGGERDTWRAYTLPIDARATSCQMCGVVTIYLEGKKEIIKKTRDYCTDYFPVNR